MRNCIPLVLLAVGAVAQAPRVDQSSTKVLGESPTFVDAVSCTATLDLRVERCVILPALEGLPLGFEIIGASRDGVLGHLDDGSLLHLEFRSSGAIVDAVACAVPESWSMRPLRATHVGKGCAWSVAPWGGWSDGRGESLLLTANGASRVRFTAQMSADDTLESRHSDERWSSINVYGSDVGYVAIAATQLVHCDLAGSPSDRIRLDPSAGWRISPVDALVDRDGVAYARIERFADTGPGLPSVIGVLRSRVGVEPIVTKVPTASLDSYLGVAVLGGFALLKHGASMMAMNPETGEWYRDVRGFDPSWKAMPPDEGDGLCVYDTKRRMLLWLRL